MSITLYSETFLQNVKSRRNRVTVQELVKAFNNNNSNERKKQAINKIFPPKSYLAPTKAFKEQQKKQPLRIVNEKGTVSKPARLGSANRTASKNARDLSKSAAKESSTLDTSLPQIVSKPPTFLIQYETPDKGTSEPTKPAFRQTSAASRDRN